MNIKIVNKSRHSLPEYSAERSAGMDLRANIDDEVTLKPLEKAVLEKVHILEETRRGEGGFGHTGNK
jgi:dUTP pyrophosphatase